MPKPEPGTRPTAHRPRPKPAKPTKRPANKTLAPPQANLCPPGYSLWLSCDWADEAHDIRVWDPIAATITAYHVKSGPEALQPFLLEQQQKAPTGKIGVIVENHRGSFIHQVRHLPGFVLHALNPKVAAKYRQALHPSGAKSDPIDADMLMRFAITHLDLCPAQEPDTAETRLLGQLSEDRRRLVNERTATTNQLTAILKGFFPQALELIGEIDRPMATDFLKRWPSLQAVKKAKPATLKTFYYQHNSRRPELMEERLQIISQAVALTDDSALMISQPMRIQSLVGQLEALNSAIKTYDQELATRSQAHPDYAIFKSVPGAGAALIPRLIALYGTKRDRWPDALSLLTYTGVAPIMISSGKETLTRQRHACPKFARQTLVELAATSLNVGCPWAKDYQARKQALGWSHTNILYAIAYKWGRILWKIWRTRTAYDETMRPRSLTENTKTPKNDG